MKAEKIVPIQEPVVTETVPSLKKIDTPRKEEGVKPEEKAKEIVDQQLGIVVVETSIKELAPDFTVEMKTDQAQIVSETFQTISVTEVHSEIAAREIKKKKKKVDRKVEEESVIQKIIEEQKESIAREVEEIMEFFKAPEFKAAEKPLRELAAIGYLVRHGITVHEINESLYRSDDFPALKTPDAQNALVQLVEREGHGALITQVLTEETTVDESIIAATVGFRAFMKMVELQHATVEEVITHFTAEDFRPRAWEVTEGIEVIF